MIRGDCFVADGELCRSDTRKYLIRVEVPIYCIIHVQLTSLSPHPASQSSSSICTFQIHPHSRLLRRLLCMWRFFPQEHGNVRYHLPYVHYGVE